MSINTKPDINRVYYVNTCGIDETRTRDLLSDSQAF